MKPGLQHLHDVFDAETPNVSDVSDGVSIIAASGDVGEARLVARQIRTWMTNGVSPTSIAVVLRDLPQKTALLSEVFDDYDVPASWTPVSIARCGAIVTLRKAWSLARNDFRFRDVAALWRNSYFQPEFEKDLSLRAETLLRQLGVPKGQQAYLDALVTTAEDRLPLPLEDESMTSTARAARSQLAKRCLGFGQWFFRLFDTIPISAAPQAMVKELRKFSDALGLDRSLSGIDTAAWSAFWSTLDVRAAAAKRPSVTLADFDRVLNDVAAKTEWPKPTVDGVRVLPADDAAEIACTHLILMNLSEGIFPRFQGPATPEVQGVERALFASLLRRPTESLVLSYAALDAKGQALLPATFLRDVQSLFADVAITRQEMLVDGFLTWPAISAAEVRAQAAKANVVSDNLRAAKRMADARFHSGAPKYSGMLAHPPVLEAIASRFGANYMFSPTSLETYIACPFKFLMQKALKLQPLEEPSEEVEVSRRGSAIHRALARFHGDKPHDRPNAIPTELDANWSRAVEEHVDRTPSAAGRVLWSLERRRVKRSLNHYPKQWSEFQDGWKKQGAEPLPTYFEAMFGYDEKPESKPALVLKVDDVEVRLGGIIDRVDVASIDSGLGFWVIDYKTGRGTQFSGRDLLAFERLQLPLYALALERVFHKGDSLRPLGMSYWIILEEGPKRVLPVKREEYSWLLDAERWPHYRSVMERVVARMVSHLRDGDFRLAPRHKKSCNYCDYATICRINQQRGRLMPLELIEEQA